MASNQQHSMGSRRIRSGNLGWSRVSALKVAVACASLVACSAVMSGCEIFGGWGEPKVDHNGKLSTAAEIRAATDAAAREAERSAKAQADTMAANLRAEADAAKIAQARRKSELDEKVATLDGTTRIALAKLQAEYEIGQQETLARITGMAADTERAVATLAANAAAKIDAAKASGDAALVKIAEIGERREGLLSAAVSGAGLVPGYGGWIAAAIAAVGGIAFGKRGTVPAEVAKKREDDAWKEAGEEAHNARDKADTLYVEGKRESELGTLLTALVAQQFTRLNVTPVHTVPPTDPQPAEPRSSGTVAAASGDDIAA